MYVYGSLNLLLKAHLLPTNIQIPHKNDRKKLEKKSQPSVERRRFKTDFSFGWVVKLMSEYVVTVWEFPDADLLL